ncbi:MAG: ATP-grasp domain-containing protein [Bdellovibrionaceae bacterium]|nr:ATP-grasp domain-containing protein [Pseudobdellovibrionaceae bacterium]
MHFDVFQKFKESPFSVLRSSHEPTLIVYDVLGHFPQPRNSIPKELAYNFNLRSKNGFLFSKKKDVVLTSELLNSSHRNWLQESGLAQGEACLAHYDQTNPHTSYAEIFVTCSKSIAQLKKLVQSYGVKSLFSWMNTETEMDLAKSMNIDLAWTSDLGLIQNQFNKTTFKTFLASINLPIVRGGSFAFQSCATLKENLSLLEKQIQILDDHSSPSGNPSGSSSDYIIKPVDSAAGCSVVRFTYQDRTQVLEKIVQFENTNWLIEKYIAHEHSVNIQTFIQSDAIYFLGASEQILDDFSYQGNIWDNRLAHSDAYKNALHQTKLISKRLQEMGYRGLIGLDFLLLKNGLAFCLENNIRINGSTFALTLIAEIERRGFSLLNWCFKKYQIEGIVPFPAIADTLHASLVTIPSFKDKGIFIQEYHTVNNKTVLALIFIAVHKNDLNLLEADLIKRLETFNEIHK